MTEVEREMEAARLDDVEARTLILLARLYGLGHPSMMSIMAKIVQKLEDGIANGSFPKSSAADAAFMTEAFIGLGGIIDLVDRRKP